MTAATRTKPARPKALPVLFGNIPAELRAKPQWVVWRYEERKDKKGEVDWTKIPYTSAGTSASSTDPATWSTFEAVRAAYERGGWDGVGLIHLPDDNLTGCDWDKVRDPAAGEVTDRAADEIRRLGTYAEVSPSGRGVRAYARGMKPGRKANRNGFEMYDGLTAEMKPGGRFLTVTGHRLDGAPATINDRQGVIDELYRERLEPPKTEKHVGNGKTAGGTAWEARVPWYPPDGPLSDDDLLRFIEAGTDRKLTALWNGDTSGHGEDDSRADAALLAKMAYYIGGIDEDRLDNLFRRSRLFREKWNRTDYRVRTFKYLRGVVTEFRRERTEASADGAPPDVPPGVGNDAGTAAGPTGWEVIRDHFAVVFRPAYKDGDSVHTEAGRVVRRVDACAAMPPELIGPLKLASNAPRFKGGGVNDEALPGFFRKWAGTAWAALLAKVPEEEEADLDAVGHARETFTRLVRETLQAEVTHSWVATDERGRKEERVERRSLIGWCDAWAKPGPWRSIRSKECFTRQVDLGNGEARLEVAIRHGLFAQMKADRRLIELGSNKFTRLATRYGVGSPCGRDRVHGKHAVILAPELVTELTFGVPTDDEEIWLASEKPNTPDGGDQIPDDPFSPQPSAGQDVP